MHIFEKLKTYISNSKIVCKSNIMITDLNKIQLLDVLDNDIQKITISDYLNEDILDIINLWNSNNCSKSNLFCVLNKKCFKLFKDDHNLYSAQMIFPLFNNNTLNGLIIFSRTTSDYIETSIKSVSGMIKFTNEIINKEI